MCECQVVVMMSKSVIEVIVNFFKKMHKKFANVRMFNVPLQRNSKSMTNYAFEIIPLRFVHQQFGNG